MEKELKKIIKWIKENYKDLPKSKIDDKELIIFSTGDFSGEYGYGSSDLKSWGVDKDGKFFWAFASGCSCYCGTDAEEKDIKLFEVEKYPYSETDLLKVIGLFNTDIEKFKENIASYEYSSWG
jgi:hypothetical protein